MSAKPVFQITEKQFAAGLARLEAKWAAKHIPHTPALAKRLYRYEVFNLVDNILAEPGGSGGVEEFEPWDAIRLFSAPPARYTARTSDAILLSVSNAQIEATAKNLDELWRSRDGGYPQGRISFSLIKRVVVNALCRMLDRVLNEPDRDGTVTDLYNWRPRFLRKYLTRYSSV